MKYKREPRDNLSKIQVVVIDATEQEIERPKKGHKDWYSGKKRHTIKTLIVADAETKEITPIAQAKGETHDFKLFMDSCLGTKDDILLLADSVFQGIMAFHNNSLIPIIKSKNKR